MNQSALRELLHYNPETGVFTWRANRRPTVKSGDIAGSLRRDGYRGIKINGTVYLSHRLACLYVSGRWPQDEMDHRNGVRDDNRWANLREATTSENHQNIRLNTSNTSGRMGVSWDRRTAKWRADITVKSRAKTLGYFEDKDAAATAYLQAKALLHPFNPTVRAA